jgi:hypothetical protein
MPYSQKQSREYNQSLDQILSQVIEQIGEYRTTKKKQLTLNNYSIIWWRITNILISLSL